MSISRKPVRGHPTEYTQNVIDPRWWPTDPPVDLDNIRFTTGLQPRSSPPSEAGTVYYWCLTCNRCLRNRRSPFCDLHRDYARKQHRNNQYAASTATVRIPRQTLEELHHHIDRLIDARTHQRVTGRLVNQLKSQPATSADALANLREAGDEFANARGELNAALDSLQVFVRQNSALAQFRRQT